MKFPSNEGDGVPTNHLFSPNEASRTETWYIQMSSQPKGFHENPQTTKAVAIL